MKMRSQDYAEKELMEEDPLTKKREVPEDWTEELKEKWDSSKK